MTYVPKYDWVITESKVEDNEIYVKWSTEVNGKPYTTACRTITRANLFEEAEKGIDLIRRLQ